MKISEPELTNKELELKYTLLSLIDDIDVIDDVDWEEFDDERKISMITRIKTRKSKYGGVYNED